VKDETTKEKKEVNISDTLFNKSLTFQRSVLHPQNSGHDVLLRPILQLTMLPVADAIDHVGKWLRLVREMYLGVFEKQGLSVSLGVRYTLSTLFQHQLLHHTEGTVVKDLTAEQLSFGVRLIDAINEHTLGDPDIPYPAGWLGIDDASAWVLESKIIRLNNHGTICHTLDNPVVARTLESRRLDIAAHPADPMQVTRVSLGSLSPEQWHTLDRVQDTTPTDAQHVGASRSPKPIPEKPQGPPRSINSKLWEDSPLSTVDSKESDERLDDDPMDHPPQDVSSTSTIPPPTDLVDSSFMTPSKTNFADANTPGEAYCSLLTPPSENLSDSSDEEALTTPPSHRVLFRDVPTLIREPLPPELAPDGMIPMCNMMTISTDPKSALYSSQATGPSKHLSILDTGASLHFSGNKEMVKHGTNISHETRPVKSATGSARVTRMAVVQLHLYPVDRHGAPEKAIVISQEVRYIPEMQKNLTLLSTGVLMRSLRKEFPGRRDNDDGPELHIVEGNNKWSYIALTDKTNNRRFIPILKDNDIYYAKVSYGHNGEDLAHNVATNRLQPRNKVSGEPAYAARDDADDEDVPPRRTRPVFKASMDVLHFAFAHCGIDTLRNTIKRSKELEATTNTITNCASCYMSKSTMEFHDANTAKPRRRAAPTPGDTGAGNDDHVSSVSETFEVGQEISLDPVPFPTSTFRTGKFKWAWLMVDRRSRYMFVDFTERKDATAAEAVIRRLAIIMRKFGWDLTTIKHDGEASLKDILVNTVCDEFHIRNVTCLARSPNTNRIEQMVRHVKNKLRCTLHAAQLPISEFWVPALCDVIHKHNTLGMKAIDWKSPYELIHRHPPRLHRTRAFGSMAYVVRPHDKRKQKVGSLAPYAVPCLVLNEASDRPGWHIWRSDGIRASATQHLIIHDLCRPRDKPPSMVKELGLLIPLPGSNRTKGAEGLALDLPHSITGISYGAAENTLGDWSCFQPRWSHPDGKIMQIPIGLPLCRPFMTADDKVVWYRGVVISVSTDDNEVTQYRVRYTDDDEEDLDATEVTDAYKTWTKAIAAREPNVPHMPTYLFTQDDDDAEDVGGLGVPVLADDDEQINDDAGDIIDSDSDTVDDADAPDPHSASPVVRRGTRVRKAPTIFSPGNTEESDEDDVGPPPPVDVNPDVIDQDQTEDNTHSEEKLNVIYFVTDDDHTYCDDHTQPGCDGVFEIDQDNHVTSSALRCGYEDDCAASAFLYRDAAQHTTTVKEPVAYAAGKALNYRTAMRSAHMHDYKAAADKEIDQLDDLDVLRYVTKEEMLRINKDAVPLLMGWALVRKIDSLTGQVKSTKGRAYLRGDMSIPDRDYCANSVYSNTVSIDSVKLALGLAAAHNHNILSFDVSGAFLQSRPSRTVFVKLPEGYRRVDENNQELYALLTRALYGSPESGARWSDDCDMTLEDHGWKRSIAEPYLYRTTAHIGGNDLYNHESLGDDKPNIPGEMTTQCIKRVRQHMDKVKTRYETREKKMSKEITATQKQLQDKRKIRHPSACYTMTRSDDIQNRHLHKIPEGEAFPMLRPYDEKTLCSSLPKNDEPNILWCNLLLFVDDGLVITNNVEFGKNAIEAFLRVHPGRMEVKPQSFLGLGISYHKDGAIALTQTPLIEDVAKVCKMEDCHSAHTPITRLVDKSEAPDDDSFAAKKANDKDFPYRTVLGKILYACHSRPELRLATSQWARVATNPGETHKQMIKRGVKYLKGTATVGVTYGKHKYSNHDPFIVCDANHGEGSISGIIGFSGGGAFAARSWAQKNASLYSFGSEQIALTDAAKLGIWTKEVVLDMGMPLKGPMRIYDDSQALIKAATTDVSSTKTRHLRTRMAWVKDMIREGRIELAFVGTKDNVADALTKPLPRDSFRLLRDQMLGLTPVTCRMVDLAREEEQKIINDDDSGREDMNHLSNDDSHDSTQEVCDVMFHAEHQISQEWAPTEHEVKPPPEVNTHELLNVNNRGALERCQSI
jgi:hypothetical protein